MGYVTLYSYTDYESGGILSENEVVHEAEKISKSIESVIEQEFNKFEKRITIYRGDTNNPSNETPFTNNNSCDVN